METFTSIAGVRRRVREWRNNGERIAFVPTMGNLHPGHLSLVERAKALADRVVASIFVNPLQFGANEDLDAYPHTPEEDSRQLTEHGVDLLFHPQEKEMYPNGREAVTWVEVPGISEILCGASRPGHFRGVATVVAKLFNIVQPDVAVFGEKDFQQLAVLRRMVSDLCMPVELAGVPTVRESDGLAMSSRNGYLTTEQRSLAPSLYRTLQAVGEQLRAGRSDYPTLEREANAQLASQGFRPDYLTIRRTDLSVPAAGDCELVILVAAHLGKARLIDNLLISL